MGLHASARTLLKHFELRLVGGAEAQGRLGARALLVPVAFIMAIATGRYVATHGLTYREGIVLLVTVLGAAALSKSLAVAFAMWVWTLGLGYRTFHLTPVLHIHPAEILLWGLLSLVLLRKRASGGSVWRGVLPVWLVLFMPFWLWAWLPGLQAGRAWDVMLSEFRDFALLVPLFVVASEALRSAKDWRIVLLSFYATGTWIALMGTVEYFFPGVTTLFPGFISDDTTFVTVEGFKRANFSFWGHSSASFTCALALPFAVPLWRWAATTSQRVAVAVGLTLQLVGVFIGGYRSMWLVVGAQIVAWLAWRRGLIVAGLVVLLAVIALPFLPSGFHQRLDSLVLTLEGRPQDSSGVKRWYIAVLAVEACFRQPWGYGWAGVWWVHSDFIQVASTMGLLGGLVFLGGYFSELKRLGSRAAASRDDDKGLGVALLLSFLCAGWILATQPVVLLPQQVLPVWFAWVLAATWVRSRADVGRSQI